MPGSVADFALAGLALVAGLFVLLAIVDATAIEMAKARAGADPAAQAPHRPIPRRRLGAAIVALVLVLGAGAFGVSALGSDPLRAAGPATGAGPLYLGTEPATYGGHDLVDFAAVPGAEISYGFALENDGPFPLTVTTLLDPTSGTTAWDSDAIFQSGRLTLAGQTGSTRFEIAAHGFVAVTLTLHLRLCSTWPAAATLAPGQTPSAWAALDTGRGVTSSWPAMPIRYEMLGLVHDAQVGLPAQLGLVEQDRGGCPTSGSDTTTYP